MEFEDAELEVGADEEVPVDSCEDEDVGAGVDMARIA